jgi:hypothetical protein
MMEPLDVGRLDIVWHLHWLFATHDGRSSVTVGGSAMPRHCWDLADKPGHSRSASQLPLQLGLASSD